jgi:hypothetical protein
MAGAGTDTWPARTTSLLAQVLSSMDLPSIAIVFGASTVLTFASFWLHTRTAGTGERVGPFSMGAFVFGWLCALTAFVTGAFLLMVALTR